jgi:hypothetical protein
MILLLALCFWFGQSQQSPAKSQTPASAQQQAAQNEPSAIPQQDTRQSRDEGQQRQANAAHWSDPMAILTIFLVIGVFVTAAIYYKQLKKMEEAVRVAAKQGETMEGQLTAMQDQLDAINKQEGHLATQAAAAKTQSEVMARQTTIMDKTLVFGTRAYVGVKKLGADYRGRKIHLIIENVGRVPANNIQIMLEFRVQILRTLLPLTQPPTGWHAKGYDPDCWGKTIPFLHAYGKRTKLFPGQPLDVITFIEPYHLARSEIMLVELGEGVRVRIRGEIRYSDGFHRDKVTHYDFRYLGGEWIPQQLDDPRGLYGDQYKPDTDYEPS